MKIRPANRNDIPLILSFIQRKAQFDRDIGAFSGVLQVSPLIVGTVGVGTLPSDYNIAKTNAFIETF